MAVYEFENVSSGSWSDASLWVTGGKVAKKPPGAADSAIVDAFGTNTVVTTDGETVANVTGFNSGASVILNGQGLTVTGTMRFITLEHGVFSASVAADVTLRSGKLSANVVGGVGGGAVINGGTVTQSGTFRGEVDGGVVNTTKLVSAGQYGGVIKAAAAVISDKRSLTVAKGDFNAGAVTLNSGGYASVSGGRFSDSGALTIEATSSVNLASFGVSGGNVVVSGSARIGGFGLLDVAGDGHVTLSHGLVVNASAGKTPTANVSVGLPYATGGEMTVTAGAVTFGGDGASIFSILKGRFDALTSDVVFGATATSSTTVTVDGGSLEARGLTVGDYGAATLTMTGGMVDISQKLEVAAQEGATGVIKLSGDAYTRLDAGEVFVGLAQGSEGSEGEGEIDIGKDGNGNFRSTTIEIGSKIVDNGDLEIHGDLAGSGTLKIGMGGSALIGGAVAHSDHIAFDGAGMLNLLQPHNFHAPITGFGAGDSVDCHGFDAAAHWTFRAVAANEAELSILETGANGHLNFARVDFIGHYVKSNFFESAGDITFHANP